VSRGALGAFADGVDDATLGAALLEELAVAPGARATVASWAKVFAHPPQRSASVAAAAWRERASGPVAIELVLDHHVPIDLGWLASVIAKADHVSAVSYVVEPALPFVGWRWPLSVATLDDAASLRVRARLENLARGPFVTLRRALAATAPIEVLVVPAACTGEPSTLAAARCLPRVQLVLVVGETGIPFDVAAALRIAARADAIGVVPVAEALVTKFVDEVLHALSRGATMDVALATTCRAGGLAPPLLLGAAGAFQRAELRMWGASLGAHAMTVDPGITRGPRSPRQVGEELVDDRFLQAELFEGAKRIERGPLQPVAYNLDIWVGAARGGALQAKKPFPASLLDEHSQEHVLSVVLTGRGEAGVVRELRLPRTGDSQRVSFALVIGADEYEIAARITVLHEQRVLQTVILRADVGDGGSAKLELAIEGIVTRDLTQIAGRRPFDAALITNDLGSGPAVSVFARDRASVVPSDASIDKLTREIGAELAKATNNAARYGTPDTKATSDLLAGLARKGFLLREALLEVPSVRDDLMSARRIQIISAKPERETLPLELCYDGPAPGVGAKTCANWKVALEQGACDGGCPADRSTVVCPLSFWGLSRIIERHAYVKATAAELATNMYALQSEPGNSRARLPIANGSICAAADRARAADAPAVDAAFAEAGEVSKPHLEVTSWTDWKAKIASNPSLLVLLSHSDVAGGVRTLVIGEEESLFLSSIDETYVGRGGGAGPVVLLLGCSTATTELAFQSFVGRFRRGGASIVVGTLCEILGRHAAPIARELLAELHAASESPEGAPLGDLMQGVRRRLLARGIPIILAVTAYGDADWQI
jgi:hypothetical protein